MVCFFYWDIFDLSGRYFNKPFYFFPGLWTTSNLTVSLNYKETERIYLDPLALFSSSCWCICLSVVGLAWLHWNAGIPLRLWWEWRPEVIFKTKINLVIKWLLLLKTIFRIILRYKKENMSSLYIYTKLEICTQKQHNFSVCLWKNSALVSFFSYLLWANFKNTFFSHKSPLGFFLSFMIKGLCWKNWGILTFFQ